MYRESAVNPVFTERGGGGGYGLVQWTPKSSLISHASKTGLTPYTNGNNQCAIIQRELINPSVMEWYPLNPTAQIYNFWETWMSQTSGAMFIANSENRSISDMTACFIANYLRPGKAAAESSLQKGIDWANKCYEWLTGENPPSPDPDPPHSSDKPIPDWNVNKFIQYGALRKVIYDIFLN